MRYRRYKMVCAEFLAYSYRRDAVHHVRALPSRVETWG